MSAHGSIVRNRRQAGLHACLLFVALGAGCSGSTDDEVSEMDSGRAADSGSALEDGGLPDDDGLDATDGRIPEEGGSSQDAGLDASDGSVLEDAGSLEDAGLDASADDASKPDGQASDASAQGCHEGDFVFDDDFSQGLRPAYWTIRHTPDGDAGVFVYDDTQDELHFSKVGQASGGSWPKNIGAVLDLTAAGGPVLNDFEMQVDFRDARLGASPIDQIELHSVFGDGTIFYTVYSNEGGLGFHVWDGGFQRFVASAATAGRLKISRVGTTLSAYAVTATSDAGPVETLIYSKQQSATPPELTLVRFVAQLFNTNNAISVTFDDFHLEGSCAQQ